MIMKRLNLQIPAELHRRFKIACTLQGSGMSEVVRRLIETYVEKTKKRKLIVVPRRESPQSG